MERMMYDGMVDFLKQYYESMDFARGYLDDGDDRVLYIFRTFEEWFEKHGKPAIESAFSCMDTGNAKKQAAFAEYYGFLLSCSNNSFDKLMDILYAVPKEMTMSFSICDMTV